VVGINEDVATPVLWKFKNKTQASNTQLAQSDLQRVEILDKPPLQILVATSKCDDDNSPNQLGLGSFLETTLQV
jgi:hypothetical protein